MHQVSEAATGRIQSCATAVPSTGVSDHQANAVIQTKFISFAIGDDRYGVDFVAVREIKGRSDVAHLPKQPDYVCGVLNLRGAIVPIADLRCRVGQGLIATPTLHVIIVQIGGRPVGLIGDRVLDIVAVESTEVQSVPRTTCGGANGFLAGLVTGDDTIMALIDLTSLPSIQGEQGLASASETQRPPAERKSAA